MPFVKTKLRRSYARLSSAERSEGRASPVPNTFDVRACATSGGTVPAVTPDARAVVVRVGHGRRELVHANVSAGPTAACVWRQVIQAAPCGDKPRQLLHDRDAVYGHDFGRRAQRIGIAGIATPIH